MFAYIITLYVSVHGTLTATPIDTFVQAGKSVHLFCRTDLHTPIAWYLKTVQGDVYEVFSSGFVRLKFRDTVKVTPTNGWYNLTIEDVRNEHAGRYSCLDNDNLRGCQRMDVQLVVLGIVDRPFSGQ